MGLPNEKYESYLGDGVYAVFDGHSIWLRTGDINFPEMEICLEPEVMKSLIEYEQKVEEAENEDGKQQPIQGPGEPAQGQGVVAEKDEGR